MKSLSSVLLGVGLTLSQAWALAADSPGGAAAKGAPVKTGAAKSDAAEDGAAKSAGPKGAAKAAAGAAEPAPAGSTVALEPDGVAFGMSADDVARLYDRWWDKQFIPRYQKTNPGPKTRELDFELAEKKKVLRRVAIFDGRTSSFDKSDFREEFAHGSDETMIAAKLSRRAPTAADEKAARDAKPVVYTRRFFFYRDKLWKIYDEYRLEAASPFGADFKDATARVEASLGKAAKRTRGPDSQFENVAFDAGNTRVRVVKLPKDAIAIVRSDTALTKEVLDRRVQQANAAGPAELDDDIQAVIR